jgi:large subunit ribosomal protein L15
MNLHELYPFPEERAQRKRRGRGNASGQGGTSGRGHKGQKARSGGKVAPTFEGGQMPLFRRLPKRGFKNPFRVEYQPVSVGTIARVFAGREEVGIEDLYAARLADPQAPIKVLSDGELTTAMRITAHKFSKKAMEKIVAAGGSAVALEG